MPISLQTQWSQTPEEIHLTIVVKGLTSKKLHDALTVADLVVVVTFDIYQLTVDLSEAIDPESVKATVLADCVQIKLRKVSKSCALFCKI